MNWNSLNCLGFGLLQNQKDLTLRNTYDKQSSFASTHPKRADANLHPAATISWLELNLLPAMLCAIRRRLYLTIHYTPIL